MQQPHRFIAAISIGIWITALCLSAGAQEASNKDTQANQTRGLPARAPPAEYQFHVQAGNFTIAAEFTGHAIPTTQGPLSSEDYVAVETAVFGPQDAKIKLSAEDFTLRINGKKPVLTSQPYGLVVGSLKEPEWEPPASAEKKSKSGLSSGGEDPGDSAPPAPVKIPIEVQRSMAHRVQRAALPEGERPVPEAGLLFFPYRGK